MAYLIVVSLVWAFSFGIIGGTLAGIASMDVAFLRLAIAAVVFLPWARRVPVRLGVRLMALGTVQFGLMYFFYHAAFFGLQSHEVALYTITTPLYVVFINDIASRTFHPRYWVITALALLGSGVIVGTGSHPFAAVRTSFVFLQVANLCFAAGQLYYRRLGRNGILPLAKNAATTAGSRCTSDAHLFFWVYLGAALPLAPTLFMHHATLLAITPRQWLAIGYLGAVASGLSFFLWNIGSRKVSTPGILAVMNNLKIPLGVMVSLLLFGECVSPSSLLAGSFLILAALLVGRI